MSEKSIAIVTVATNIYLEYWKDMVISLDREIMPNKKIVSYVFTDQPELAKSYQSLLRNLIIFPIKIPPYGWPDATIRRYEIFSEFSSQINEDVIIHLDADMLVLSDIYQDFIEAAEKSPIILVAHPGFWGLTPNLRQKVKKLFSQTQNALGSWESRAISKAYVPVQDRRTYVCGGVWAGRREEFFRLTEQLADQVNTDFNNSVMAVWHDESHLNNWASKNDYLLLSPSFCFVADYVHLSGLKPKILAVEKEVRTR